MSEDYYYICEEKKVWMPAFTMHLGKAWVVPAEWVFDFVLKVGHSPVAFVSEHCKEKYGISDEDGNDNPEWEFMNAWHQHKGDAA